MPLSLSWLKSITLTASKKKSVAFGMSPGHHLLSLTHNNFRPLNWTGQSGEDWSHGLSHPWALGAPPALAVQTFPSFSCSFSPLPDLSASKTPRKPIPALHLWPPGPWATGLATQELVFLVILRVNMEVLPGGTFVHSQQYLGSRVKMVVVTIGEGAIPQWWEF